MSHKKGFTLIELLVVIAIIGLLSSVILASLSSARTKARDVRRLSDLKQISTALELYADDFGVYPGNPTVYNIDNNNYPGLPWPPCPQGVGLDPYFSINICELFDPQDYSYKYSINTDGTYNLGARFETDKHKGVPFIRTDTGATIPNYYEAK